jgi:solute carrier family 25 (mitochondrial dicarboxylate transporter), member 10
MIFYIKRYDFLKKTFLSGPIPLINYQLHDNLLLHLIASSLAGTFATSNFLALPSSFCFVRILTNTFIAVCSPADVLRSRIMASVRYPLYFFIFEQDYKFFDSKSGNTTVTQILRQSFREEGIRFMFKGWTPAFIRMAPNTVLLFVFYEVSYRLERFTILRSSQN